MDFMQEDIPPPGTTDLKDHNALKNLWAQKILTEEELSTLLDSSLDIDIEPQYDALTQRLNAISRKLWDVYRLSNYLVHAVTAISIQPGHESQTHLRRPALDQPQYAL
jgi:hypothetical protein